MRLGFPRLSRAALPKKPLRAQPMLLLQQLLLRAQNRSLSLKCMAVADVEAPWCSLSEVLRFEPTAAASDLPLPLRHHLLRRHLLRRHPLRFCQMLRHHLDLLGCHTA